MENNTKIGFGGGCHWCTEAIFQHLIGVLKVEQGWIASDGSSGEFSEAVVVHFDRSLISLFTLIEVHLSTHNSTSDHSMRKKYRSAIYIFSQEQFQETGDAMKAIQERSNEKFITEILPFVQFKPSPEQFRNYYLQNPQKPFCRTYIDPKIRKLTTDFGTQFTKN